MINNKTLLELPDFGIVPSYENLSRSDKIDWVALRLETAYNKMSYEETMKSLPRTLNGATQRTLNY